VLDLSWNSLDRNLIASGSADKSIILWDLAELKQATKIKHHADKVQTLKFHPIESYSLLSGSFDKSICLFDCRNPRANKKIWSSNSIIEKVVWNTLEPNYFFVSF
jgi:periodic tryptophan protein 1